MCNTHEYIDIERLLMKWNSTKKEKNIISNSQRSNINALFVHIRSHIYILNTLQYATHLYGEMGSLPHELYSAPPYRAYR